MADALAQNALEAKEKARVKLREVLRLCGVAGSYLATPRKDHAFSVESIGLYAINLILDPIEWAGVEEMRRDAVDELLYRLAESGGIRR